MPTSLRSHWFRSKVETQYSHPELTCEGELHNLTNTKLRLKRIMVKKYYMKVGALFVRHFLRNGLLPQNFVNEGNLGYGLQTKGAFIKVKNTFHG